jgi:MFS family permease
MTLNEFFDSSHLWAEQNTQLILLLSVAIPAVGTLLAFIGKGGKTDADGRFIASTVLGFSMLSVVIAAMALFVSISMRGASLLDANVALLAAPIICLFGSLVGLRMVFPLSELGAVRSLLDMGGFLLSLGAVFWFMSKFDGWRIHIFGSLFTFIILVALAIFFLRRQFRRTFGLDRERKASTARARYDDE